MSIKRIKVSEETKAEFDKVADEYGFTHEQMMVYLLDLYKAKESRVNQALSSESSGKTVRTNLISKDEKLRLFIDAIMKHNRSEKDKAKNKGYEPNFIHLKSIYFVSKETGMNKTRDVSPFMKSVESELSQHYEKMGGLTSAVMSKPELTTKDEKGRLTIIAEILENEGIAELFGR